ncbi:WW domain-containing oxidoreductase isoform X2 [Zootermopsis nevadensis]|uniref:WW domain-containing oxidoreductase isoform X2 n=1 Tax=Zootermopsis nevadensis TaxID=136037 RepID=UPI000B8E716E|nr:WW domain-containing oxidoreductase isoform X2 [Zootermopsis nevadensis]
MAAIMPDSDSEDELPPGWEERATVDGSVYYVNHATKGTQWTHPRTGKKKVVSGDLPFGWEKCVSEDGKVFYVDHGNRQTTYSDPRLAFATEEKEYAQDFRQRFDGSTMALQVLHGRDLAGKVAVVSGASTGIGFETARSLALHGCTVVFACRDLIRTQAAIDRIKDERANVKCDVIELDLARLRSVRIFAEHFKLNYKKLDILVLNAGVFGLPFSLTHDGYETTFQVNHLSHMYMTLLLEPQLCQGSRVIVVSSESHRFANLSGDTLSQTALSPSSATHFWSMMAYNNSKLCNILFGLELARMWEKKGIIVNTIHPGNMQQAASTTIYCATAPELDGATGLYFNNCCRCEPSKAAQDPELAHVLWQLSTKMIQAVINSEEDIIAVEN